MTLLDHEYIAKTCRRHSIFSMLPADENDEENVSDSKCIDSEEKIDEQENAEQSKSPPKILALHPSTTSTDDLPLSTSGSVFY